MAVTLQHKRSESAGAAPGTSDLARGEIGINLADLRMYTKDHTDAIKVIGGESVTGDLSFTKGDGTAQSLSVTGFKLNFTKADGNLVNFNLFQPIMMFSLLEGNYVSGKIYNSHTHDINLSENITVSGSASVTGSVSVTGNASNRITFDNDQQSLTLTGSVTSTGTITSSDSTITTGQQA